MELLIEHIAIICSDFEKSKHFYTTILGLTIIRQVYRESRNSYRLELSVGNGQFIELFSFPEFAQRPNYPEAVGLRHLAFKVKDISKTVKELDSKGIKTEDVRTDPETGIKFTFFKDPDELPIEIREIIK
ncbi:VOC family protein [Candidatus Woesebacteria bacterium]|nr:VOC family protein [Candidatus Woesebacteria bacterium]